MKPEKPAPDKADFSGKSKGSRRPETTATDTEHQERKRMLLASSRSDCIGMILRLVGEGGLQSFLKCRQPAFDDCTGDQILTRDSHGLLARLELLQKEGGTE